MKEDIIIFQNEPTIHCPVCNEEAIFSGDCLPMYEGKVVRGDATNWAGVYVCDNCFDLYERI